MKPKRKPVTFQEWWLKFQSGPRNYIPTSRDECAAAWSAAMREAKRRERARKAE